ncbi:1,6-anhydro-N-acetylmuramyl-L-alanine amidase AmpD [Comamonas flocculans]|uniref:1,6-anhydro-N-acetylmuramyl-L-alanine amidase AmpD n=1 Tax=Comamonas flocculans TaxID=2597701 RepID=A0A5B8RYX3_9BURK|nr:1,6-anhydro-N-acetylmuramyl-L-alanine amidase AmpD [Comamonas flocculans]QEA13435.1 1,6-anhydro-N-acetylmuramyl-L-alanine amidase AmpD [Comamonas flocculans]
MARSPEPGVWRGGWLACARTRPSPNFDARPQNACVDLIVLHSISLPPGAYGTGATAALFLNQLDWDAHPYYAQIRGLRVSSHFFITRKGVLWQFVDADQRAWHAGASHWRLRGRCNDDAVGVELEGLEGECFEPAQYATLLCLFDALRTRYPVRYVAGHEHIAPARKNDPGSGFDWELLSRHCAGSGILLAPTVRR